jgi:MFS transporter, FSR family, fosmidomycin resistance protein
VTVAAPAGATDRRALAALTLGHASSDLCQGAVPALLPFLIAERGYGYAAAAALVLAMTVASSIAQPLFGYLADRRPVGALMPLGVLVGGVGIAATGLVSSYALTLAAVAVSGLGVAAFHPEGARYANSVSGDRAAAGMSVFAVGGNAGFALGPLLVTPLVLALGLAGTAWLAILPALAALVLAVQGRRLTELRRAGAAAGAGAGRDRWRPFARLAAVAAGRSGVYAGLQAFIALYLIEQLGASTAEGNAALTVMVVAGALGTLAGGRLADRLGRRTVVVGFLATLTPLLALLLLADTLLAFPLLALIGFFCVGNFTVTVVMGQELLPGNVGVASGVTLGAAIGAGGLIAAALGVLADHAGLVAVMVAIAALPLPTLALALTLPADGQ